VQAYVDDMVVTSKRKDQHISNLEGLFPTIEKYNLKLNPDKCVFGVEAGKFLGFLLIERGIEMNPEICTAIIGMRSPTNVKLVQQLTMRMASLSRFLSTSGDKGYHYFQSLKNNRFVWTSECEEAFTMLKEYLARPLFLVSQSRVPLFVFILRLQIGVSTRSFCELIRA